MDLSDATYDGLVTDGGRRLTGGLGQLTDGELGQSNFRVDRHGARGYEWIGWRRRDDPGDQTDFVELSFRFDALRNFSGVSFHANNQFTRDVRVFRAARLTFSSGGGRDRTGLRSGTVNYAYLRDDVIEYARMVPVTLQHQVGDQVTVRLYFDAKWLLISEVQFESGIEQCLINIIIKFFITDCQFLVITHADESRGVKRLAAWRYSHSYYGRRIGNRTQSFKWYQFQ